MCQPTISYSRHPIPTLPLPLLSWLGSYYSPWQGFSHPLPNLEHSAYLMLDEKMTPMFPPIWIMVLLHFLVDLSLYVIPKRVSQELAGHRRFCLLSKVNTLNGHGQANQHLSPQRASPYIPTWLAGNIWFTWIPHFDWVDHRVIGHTGNQVLGWSPMRVLFRPRSSHEIQVKATGLSHPLYCMLPIHRS